MDAESDFAAAVPVEGARDGGGGGGRGGRGSLVAEVRLLGFLCEHAVARGEEERRHGAEEPPRPDLLLAVHGGDAGGAATVGHDHAVPVVFCLGLYLFYVCCDLLVFSVEYAYLYW